MPKRRVDYVRDRIARGAGRRERGSGKNGVTVQDGQMGMGRSIKPKALGKGGGGRTLSVGKELYGGRDKEEVGEGVDFLAELRAAFRTNETEELASDDDLATLSAVALKEEGYSSSETGDIDRPLVVPWAVPVPGEENGGVEGGNPVEAFEEIRVEGPHVLGRDSAREANTGVSMRRTEGRTSGGVEGDENEQETVLSLEDIKKMKVCGAVMVHLFHGLIFRRGRIYLPHPFPIHRPPC